MFLCSTRYLTLFVTLLVLFFSWVLPVAWLQCFTTCYGEIKMEERKLLNIKEILREYNEKIAELSPDRDFEILVRLLEENYYNYYFTERCLYAWRDKEYVVYYFDTNKLYYFDNEKQLWQSLAHIIGQEHAHCWSRARNCI